MDRSYGRRLVGRILILALLACIAIFAVMRFRGLQDSQRPLQLLELETYHDLTGTAAWGSGSELSPELAESILNSYLKAWTAWNLALLGDTQQRLDRHFSGPALHKIRRGLNKQQGLVVQRDGEHQLELRFLSDDFTVAELGDVVRVERSVLDEGKVVKVGSVDESYEVLMILQDGLWRVEQWKRSERALIDDEKRTQ